MNKLMEITGDYAAYIGAGLDTVPLQYLNVKNFVFVDSQPRSDYRSDWENAYNKKKFFINLIERMRDINYDLISYETLAFISKDNVPYINPGLVYFKNDKNQNVWYYYSHYFPNDITYYLVDHLEKCTILIANEYDPHIDILSHMKKCDTFIGFPNAIYQDSEIFGNEKQSTFYYLERYPKTFEKYILATREKPIITYNFNDFVSSVNELQQYDL